MLLLNFSLIEYTSNSHILLVPLCCLILNLSGFSLCGVVNFVTIELSKFLVNYGNERKFAECHR
jgi:hypothetical protein